jgi:hypothetical protein
MLFFMGGNNIQICVNSLFWRRKYWPTFSNVSSNLMIPRILCDETSCSKFANTTACFIKEQSLGAKSWRLSKITWIFGKTAWSDWTTGIRYDNVLPIEQKEIITTLKQKLVCNQENFFNICFGHHLSNHFSPQF